MNRFDWIVTALFVAVGLLCMTASATSLLERPASHYIQTFLSLCIWIVIPLILIGAGYYFVRRSHKKGK